MLDVVPDAIPDMELLELIYQHQGLLTETALREAGYIPEELCRERVLTRIGAGQYRLFDELTYVDGLVLLQWAVPEGVVAGLTALSYHELTVVLPGRADVAVPQGWQGTIPDSVGPVHVMPLPPDLFDYGITAEWPDVPGTVPVRMYAPAVAVAQVLADPTADREAQEECVPAYLHRFKDSYALQKGKQALEEALARYQVREIPRSYYAPAALR